MCIAVLLEETLLIRMFRLDIDGSRLGTSKKSTLFHCRIAEFSIMAFALIDDGCDGCGDDPFPAFPARGWSMRRGHRKAIETRIIRKSESLERIRWSNAPSLANVGLGRSAVKRSVNRSCLDVLRRKRWAARQSKLGYYLDSFQVTSMH